MMVLDSEGEQSYNAGETQNFEVDHLDPAEVNED